MSLLSKAKALFTAKTFFLTPEERAEAVPLLTDHHAVVALLIKTRGSFLLRVEELAFTPVVPLGTLVIPIPERLQVQDNSGKVLEPKGLFYLAVDSTQGLYTLVDLRPDKVAPSLG